MDGVVLAGGPGRRFGRPKATIVLDGAMLVERAVETLAAHCAHVVVVSRPGIPLPPLDVDVVFDRPGPDCPLVAVATGLASVTAASVIVLGCDLPFAAPLVARLAEAPDDIAVVGVDGGRPQPLCARYPRERTLAEADRLLAVGALPVRGLLDAVSAAGIDAEGDELLNVNTPGDLARALEIIARG